MFALIPVLTITAKVSAGGVSISTTDYPLPTTGIPQEITSGSDGNLWFIFAGNASNPTSVVRMTTSGSTQFLNNGGFNANVVPQKIITGPDGALWYSESTYSIGTTTVNGGWANYGVPASGSSYPALEGIASGPDSAIWFTEGGTDKIGRFDLSSHTTIYYSLPSGSYPYDITTGSDGALWFTELQSGKIGRITTSGSITEYTIPSGGSPYKITSGPDGALWFTEEAANKIGRISTSGVIDEYATGADSHPYGITSGPDGALWFAVFALNGGVGRITTDGAVTTFPITGAGVADITSGPDGALWFTDTSRDEIGRVQIVPSLSTPENLAAVSPTQHSQLSWGAVGGATGYNVYRDGTKIDSTTSASYTDTTAPEGTDSYYVTAVNGAGESSPSNTVTVLVDRTAPAITATTSPPPNSDGWNNQPVTVTFNCSDGGSGIDTCTSPQTVSSDGETTITGTAVDGAGNTATTSVHIKLDTVNPTITFTAASDGWVNTDADIPYTCTNDDGTTSNHTAPITTNPGGTTTATGTCTDEAGNTTTQTIPVQVDPTAPQVDYSLSQPTNSVGWSTGPVTVTFQCDDPAGTSGVASGIASCSDPVTVTDEGTTTVTGKAVDRAGNATEVHVQVNIDSVKPTLNYTLSPALPNGANGWYTSNVTINFTCSDATSGVASCPQSRTVSTDGDQTITATAVDVAGNQRTVTIPIKLDKTAPVLGDITLGNSHVVYGSHLTTSFTADAADVTSGITHAEYYVDTDPGQGNGANLSYADNQVSGSDDFSSLSVGTHTLYMRAQDAAGNWSVPVSKTFTVSYPIPVAPTNLTAVTPTNHSINLSWSATFDPTTPPAVSYNIYRNNTLVGTSATTTFSDTGLSSDGTYSYYVTAVNQYGVESDQSNLLVAVYDTTAPTVIYTLSPVANSNGWNNGNVTATFTCSDNLSGVQSCPTSYTFSSEGAGQSHSSTATDNAGNMAAVAVSGVNIDKTAPTTGTVSASTTLLLLPGAVTITTPIADSLSGIARVEYYVDTDPGIGNGTAMTVSGGTATASVSITGGALSNHIVGVRTLDKAGNWSAIQTVTISLLL